MFPFDNLDLHFRIVFKERDSNSIIPIEAAQRIEIYNRLSDLILTDIAINYAASALNINAKLKRRASDVVIVFILIIISICYICVILFHIYDMNIIAISLCTYFITLLSMRNIIKDWIRTFPTLFDYCILILSFLLLVGLLFKFTTKYYLNKNIHSVVKVWRAQVKPIKYIKHRQIKKHRIFR